MILNDFKRNILVDDDVILQLTCTLMLTRLAYGLCMAPDTLNFLVSVIFYVAMTLLSLIRMCKILHATIVGVQINM